ncbi:hypothetical protein P8452_35563 [Trifolium repens]|nr:hypothetical protein P8452_35563 [Trifolium repens]
MWWFLGIGLQKIWFERWEVVIGLTFGTIVGLGSSRQTITLQKLRFNSSSQKTLHSAFLIATFGAISLCVLRHRHIADIDTIRNFVLIGIGCLFIVGRRLLSSSSHLSGFWFKIVHNRRLIIKYTWPNIISKLQQVK